MDQGRGIKLEIRVLKQFLKKYSDFWIFAENLQDDHQFCCKNSGSSLMLSRFSHVRLCVTPQTAATRLPRHWDSPGKTTGVGCHFLLQCMKGKSEREVTQSCLTPSDPMDCSPPGSSVHGVFQARVLEWGAIVFSKASMVAWHNFMDAGRRQEAPISKIKASITHSTADLMTLIFP